MLIGLMGDAILTFFLTVIGLIVVAHLDLLEEVGNAKHLA